MQQVLFTIPIFKSWFGGDGVPVYGFGAMLFLTFVLVTWWGSARARRVGMRPEKFQDMTIWLFLSGIVGARLLYMVQYSDQFPDKSAWGQFTAFFQIWRGGIIFYGSVLGGVVGYLLFYRFVLRRLGVSGWQLADAVAPLLALGLAIGRMGCYLNGCCWGQVACEETCPVPLGGAHFPLLPAHARDSLVFDKGLQTSIGFAVAERDRSGMDDPRTRVTVVEHNSPAAVAGVKPGDKIVKVNGRPNQIVLEVEGADDKVKPTLEALRKAGATVGDDKPDRNPRAYFDDFAKYTEARAALLREGHTGTTLKSSDTLWELARDWPRGKASVVLGVERGGEVIDLPPFSPRSVGLYPTQLYETLSMVLLIFLLLAFYPYRRHDGQLMVVCMLGYSVHRFINESLRIEPTVGSGLTLSQWGSVVIFAAAVAIEVYLWRATPSRWGPNPPPEPTPVTA